MLRRIFFLPEGFSVDRHVRQGSWSGGAVRHSTWGTLEDVPLPRIMTSLGRIRFFQDGQSMEKEPVISLISRRSKVKYWPA